MIDYYEASGEGLQYYRFLKRRIISMAIIMLHMISRLGNSAPVKADMKSLKSLE